jgi:hypothetical protein
MGHQLTGLVGEFQRGVQQCDWTEAIEQMKSTSPATANFMRNIARTYREIGNIGQELAGLAKLASEHRRL